MKAISQFPQARAVLLISNDINKIDATGQDKLGALGRPQARWNHVRVIAAEETDAKGADARRAGRALADPG